MITLKFNFLYIYNLDYMVDIAMGKQWGQEKARGLEQPVWIINSWVIKSQLVLWILLMEQGKFCLWGTCLLL